MERWEGDLKRFAQFADVQGKDECWLWGGHRNRKGYAHANLFQAAGGVHRALFMAMFGRLPTRIFVCHDCDVRPCVNPFHCFKGTNRANILDAKRKGRLAVGSRNKRTKLKVKQVRTIQKLIKAGVGLRVIGRRFGVYHSCIHRIKYGETWTHLK